MSEYEFTITDLSKGLSAEEVQNAVFSMFTTPIKFPPDACRAMTLEEFVLSNLTDI